MCMRVYQILAFCFGIFFGFNVIPKIQFESEKQTKQTKHNPFHFVSRHYQQQVFFKHTVNTFFFVFTLIYLFIVLVGVNTQMHFDEFISVVAV